MITLAYDSAFFLYYLPPRTIKTMYICIENTSFHFVLFFAPIYIYISIQKRSSILVGVVVVVVVYITSLEVTLQVSPCCYYCSASVALSRYGVFNVSQDIFFPFFFLSCLLSHDRIFPSAQPSPVLFLFQINQKRKHGGSSIANWR